MRLEARHDLGGRFSWARATSQLQGFHVCSVSGFDAFVLSVHRFPKPAVRGSMSFRDANFRKQVSKRKQDIPSQMTFLCSCDVLSDLVCGKHSVSRYGNVGE